MKINVGESLAAASIIGFAGTVVYLGSGYPLGTLDRMGPGYFPVLLGAITLLIGVATLIAVCRSDTPAPDVPWRAFSLIFLGVLAWALIAERFGLVPASFTLIVLASLARPPVNIVVMLLTAAIASAAAVVLFIHGFGLPLRAFKW